MYKKDGVIFKCPTRLPFQSDKPVYIVTVLTLSFLEYYPDFHLQNDSLLHQIFPITMSDHRKDFVGQWKAFKWIFFNG